MEQYHKLLRDILEKGTIKSAAREGMPYTKSLFGYQMRFNLADGFPLVTTKQVSFKNIATELFWFIRGDSNIKYMTDNNCNIWNEDAYNYYLKKVGSGLTPMSFETFVERVKDDRNYEKSRVEYTNYKLGDTGNQYPLLWRSWKGECIFGDGLGSAIQQGNRYVSGQVVVDQLKVLIHGLMANPMSRRHIITAWNPTTLDDMALNACHAFVQFNCREMSSYQREDVFAKLNNYSEQQRHEMNPNASDEDVHLQMDEIGIPKYYLDCQLYQRSADSVLGTPYNTASYALLTEIIAKATNMVAGEFVHTFGDAHIYSNHFDAAEEQLEREPKKLPTLEVKDIVTVDRILNGELEFSDFNLVGYEHCGKLKNETKLSTGLF